MYLENFQIIWSSFILPALRTFLDASHVHKMEETGQIMVAFIGLPKLRCTLLNNADCRFRRRFQHARHTIYLLVARIPSVTPRAL